jgi:hypothetical protein
MSHPSHADVPVAERDVRPSRRLIWSLRGAAIVLALVHTWANRWDMNPDAIAYLDIGDAYVRGDWHHALNAYWSPMYSWMLGVVMRLVHPSMEWEFPLVHAVDFAHYLLAMVAFEYFLRGLLRWRADAGQSWAWWVIGYALFIWSSLRLVTLDVLTPDMWVTALVYLAAGILVRVRLGDVRWQRFALLGAVLGVAYLSKAAMFPLGFAFVVAAGWAVGRRRLGFERALVTLAVFLAVSSPFIFALSMSKGRFTFSDTGKLAYTWFVDGRTEATNWQGTPAGTGTPRHPTRVLRKDPIVYEYATPIAGTWPPWYDASYWNEGVKPAVKVAPEMWVVMQNVAKYAAALAAIVTALVVVGVMAGGRAASGLRSAAFLLLPTLAGLALYSLVLVEWRYVASFIVVFTLAAFAAMLPDAAVAAHIPSGQTASWAPRLLRAVAVALAIALLAQSVDLAYDETGHVLRALVGRDDPNDFAIAALAFQKLGLRPGDEVGRIGSPFFDYWARLARVRIIAEVPDAQASQFWAADSATREDVLTTFARAGAKAVVAQSVPEWADTSGWLCVEGDADYMVRFLTPSGSSRTGAVPGIAGDGR